MTEAVTYTRTDLISTVTMDDGRVNVFSIPMVQSLHAAFDRAERDGTVVLLRGRPGCFSAGFDLATLSGPRCGWVRPWRNGSSSSPRRWWSPARVTPSPLAPSS